MPTYDYYIGVIGGGAAGLTVASGASQFGAKTLLIEKEKAWAVTVFTTAACRAKLLLRLHMSII